VELARTGLSVCVMEAAEKIGGGTRSAELTLPGFVHDLCSAIHPMAILSPFFNDLKLSLDWIFPPAAFAHPLPDNQAALLYPNLQQTAESLGPDGHSWKTLFDPFLANAKKLYSEILKPVRFPGAPLLMAQFGLVALRSASAFAQNRFQKSFAQALFSGCAAHSMVSLKSPGSASFGLVLALSGHAAGWPLAKGGSMAIANALEKKLLEKSGVIQTGRTIRHMSELPDARVYLFDVTPRQLLEIAKDALPGYYRRKLASFRYGPGVFKIDWALDGPIPWKASECSQAATVHVGGTMDEIVNAEEETIQGKHPEKPFVLVGQQSLFDSTRAPSGKHTGWAYCHVPNGSNIDMTECIENQMERFAPGFRDRILARHTFDTIALERHNSNLIGGDIGGGSNALSQVIARPILKWDPYSTPNPQIFLCSSSTPPGGGVHGMCGYNAARSALRRVFKIKAG
jgi:phytoene dehydrogenase-like protein